MKNQKLPRTWFIVFAFMVLLPASLSATPPGASVQAVRYDPAANIAWISIANNSKKFITGYILNVDVIHAIGPIDHGEFIEDFPGKSAVKQEELGDAWSGEGTIRPGEIYDQRYDVAPAPANPILRVEATIAVVAYSDGTADAQDGQAFERLVSERKGRFLAYQKTAQIIRKTLVNEADPNPVQSAVTSLEQLRDACKAGRTQESCIELDVAVKDLGQFFTTQWEHPVKARDYLNQWATRYEHWAAQALPHSQLWRQK
jgi:hypothetical protein